MWYHCRHLCGYNTKDFVKSEVKCETGAHSADFVPLSHFLQWLFKIQSRGEKRNTSLQGEEYLISELYIYIELILYSYYPHLNRNAVIRQLVELLQGWKKKQHKEPFWLLALHQETVKLGSWPEKKGNSCWRWHTKFTRSFRTFPFSLVNMRKSLSVGCGMLENHIHMILLHVVPSKLNM